MTNDQNVTTFDSIMPNGKRLGDCTSAEMAGFEPAVRLAAWLVWDKEAVALNKLWDEMEARHDPKDFPDRSNIVFETLLGTLVSLAKYKGADNESMIEPLFEAALECGPKGRVSRLVRNWGSVLQNKVWPRNRDEGRLFKLLYQAYSLMKCGAEDTIASVLFDLREEGHLTDEELKSEMTAIGLLSEVPDGPTWVITDIRLADQ
jgi:hypothetical protein